MNTFLSKLNLWYSHLKIFEYEYYLPIKKKREDNDKNYQLQRHIDDLSLLKD